MSRQNHPNRKPQRLQDFDYSTDGAYFITICTANRAHYFGTIQNSVMQFNTCGAIATQCWQDIPKHFPAVHLDTYVIMPNHVHGILWIDNAVPVGNCHGNSLQRNFCRRFQLIPVIISQFKSSVTRTIRKQYADLPFAWQKSFHDHIIRSDDELNRVREYIHTNPANWVRDENNMTIGQA